MCLKYVIRLQPIRTLQAPPVTKTRKESTIGETLANFASSLMGKQKNAKETDKDPLKGEWRPEEFFFSVELFQLSVAN